VIGSGQMHLVASGETLYGISVRYGITETELASANNLRDRDTIFVGQEVIIPISTVDSQTTEVSRSVTNIGNHVVQAGETLFSIASRYGVSPNSIVASNGLINPAHIEAGQTLIIPGSGGTTNIGYTPSQNVRRHTVHRGETLTSIAASYGVSVWTLATVNNLSSLSILYVDQELSIPGQSTLLSPSTVSDKNTRQIIVDISDQRTYVYSDGRLLWSFVSSTGVAGADTWRGNFTILNKIQRAYAATWNLEMPNWLGFYWAGSLQNGFHALPILWNGQRLWEGLLGQPASYGCVILSQEDSQTLYDWALIGDAVVVQD
jgi:LysM repeat protein